MERLANNQHHLYLSSTRPRLLDPWKARVHPRATGSLAVPRRPPLSWTAPLPPSIIAPSRSFFRDPALIEIRLLRLLHQLHLRHRASTFQRDTGDIARQRRDHHKRYHTFLLTTQPYCFNLALLPSGPVLECQCAGTSTEPQAGSRSLHAEWNIYKHSVRGLAFTSSPVMNQTPTPTSKIRHLISLTFFSPTHAEAHQEKGIVQPQRQTIRRGTHAIDLSATHYHTFKPRTISPRSPSPRFGRCNPIASHVYTTPRSTFS